MKTTKTYYVTKYALTDGIWEVQPGAAEFSTDPDGKVDEAYLYVGSIGNRAIQVPKTDYFETLLAAEYRVAQLVENKKKAHRKALDKLCTYIAPIKLRKPE